MKCLLKRNLKCKRQTDKRLSKHQFQLMADILQPLEEQLEEVIGSLKLKFESEEKIGNIISKLYERYVEVGGQLYQSNVSGSIHHRFENKVIEIALSKIKGNNQQYFIIYSLAYPPHFKSELDEIQFYEKRIAAQAFLRWGYSYQIYKDEVRKRGGFFDITQSRYKKICSIFMSDIYLKIERFLQFNCDFQVERSFQLKGPEFLTILYNCRRYFQIHSAITFFKFIALVFEEQCDSIEVTRSEVINLYEHSKQVIKDKLEQARLSAINLSLNNRPRKGCNQYTLRAEKKWQDFTEEEKIIELYIENPNILSIKQKYLKLFGNSEQFSNARKIKSLIFKYIRKGLKTVHQYYRQHFMILPKMTELADSLIQKILTNSQAALLRVRILKFSKLKELNISVLSDVISEIAKFVERRQRQGSKDNKQDSSSLHEMIDLQQDK